MGQLLIGGCGLNVQTFEMGTNMYIVFRIQVEFLHPD